MVREEIGVPVRNYKDSVFRMLFSERHTLLGLYNALSGTAYTDPDELEINTLKNAIYLGRKMIFLSLYRVSCIYMSISPQQIRICP